MRELILGGARSGKSLLAERRAQEYADQPGRKVIYIATAQALDGEMARRVAHHRARRPAEWGCVEETLHLPQRLRELAAPDTCLLVDCLTLWLSNLLFAGQAAAQAEAGDAIDPSWLDEHAGYDLTLRDQIKLHAMAERFTGRY